MTNKEKMRAGKLYRVDGELAAEMRRCAALVKEYNDADPCDGEGREALLRKILGSCGENVTVLPPLRCDYGKHVHMGGNVFINYDAVLLDVADIVIGDNVFIAPRFSAYTAGHPIDVEVRNEGLEFGLPITIEKNVWIGGGVTVCPGVTIGEGSVIGAGAVVTRDIPANVVAAGNPCRVIREITQEDYDYWHKLREEYLRT